MKSMAATTFVLMASASLSQAAQMSAAEIKRDIVGHSVFLAAPVGGEFPLNYHKSGRVDGDGEALGLGKFLAPKDSGKWWIKGDRLCQQFKVWYDGSPMCFELVRTGDKSLKWIRDNGEKGSARIGARLK